MEGPLTKVTRGGTGTPGSLLYGSSLLGQVTINATVEMKTKIGNRDLDDDLKNTSSAAYRDFEEMFKEKVRAQRCQG